jgi:ubiquinol-cytochrome c reductase cytochrome b subunit
MFFFSYPVSVNLSYFWNFGIYALCCLIIQLLTGIFLVMYHISDSYLAFFSIEYLMREVSFGWILRYLHANGASMFFIIIYIHIFRGLYYHSYLFPRRGIWNIGVIIFLLMIITAFLGYVLPWGQMSYWAATVITNSVSAIPVLGDLIVIWLWGGYSVDNATLKRFFSLHYLLPFIICLFVIFHILFLHEIGSSNALGVEFKYIDYVLFYPYYIYKDLFGLSVYFFFFFLVIFFFPNYLGHTDNYIMANSMITPHHIVPEWYFLPFYAILRSIPDKMFGVIIMLLSIGILLFIPYIYIIDVSLVSFKFLSRYFFWFFIFICLLLGWIGSKPAENPYIFIGQFGVVSYFSFFLIIYPLILKFESFIWFRYKFINK